jgi:hypothetical protein
MSEIWKIIDGYKALYMISNHGRVKSLRRTIIHPRSKITVIPERILKASKNKRGYCTIRLCGKGHSIHRLVALAFITNPKFKPLVNHKNGIKDDNIFSNLEWSTNQENIIHSFEKLGRIHHTSKTIRQIGADGKMIAEFHSAREAGRRLKIPHRGISRCAQREMDETFKGFKWQYV